VCHCTHEAHLTETQSATSASCPNSIRAVLKSLGMTSWAVSELAVPPSTTSSTRLQLVT
jgi:hypothetical protein